MTKKQQDLDTFGSNNEGKYVLANIGLVLIYLTLAVVAVEIAKGLFYPTIQTIIR